MPKLVVFRGEAIEAEIQLGAGACVRIGRDKQNDVVLDDPERGVSRFHAEVRSEGGVYTIVDVGSRNGIWLNGQAIKQATLKPGVLVAVGPFEVMLEDHLSTAMFGSAPVPRSASRKPTRTSRRLSWSRLVRRRLSGPPPKSPAAVSPSTTVQVRLKAAWSGFATMARGVGMGALQDRRQMMLWSGAAVVLIVLVLGGVMIVRRTPASDLRTAENNTSAATTSVPFTPPPPDPNAEVIAQHLSAGRDALAAGRREDALRELQAVIDLDASNAAALELQQQAQALPPGPESPTQKPEAQRGAGARPPRTVTPQETETPGIPRRANEPYTDYTSRAVRIQKNYAQARDSLEKKKYAEAIGFLKELERDQSAFQDSGLMLADATTRQRADFNDAMSEGQREQQAGRLLPAFRAYQRAEQIDKTQNATDRVGAVWAEMLKQANELFTRANTAAKIGSKAQARDGYQKVIDLLPDGAELKERAQKGLEDLK